MRKAKVFWSLPEVRQVADKLVEMSASPLQRGFCILANEAQKAVLPADRQRVIQSKQHIPPMLAELVTIGLHNKTQKIVAAAKEEATPPPKPEAPPPRPKGILESFLGHCEGLLVNSDSLLDGLERLNDNLERIALIAERFMDHQAGQPPEPITANGEPERTKRKKVVVVGCNADQLNAIRKKHEGTFNITGLERYSPRLKSSIEHADAVIGMTKFMRHTTEYAIKAVANDRYHRVNGGTSDVNQLLTGLTA